MMKVGDRLAELLVHNGVDRVFGVPGGQTLPLYEGIRKLEGQIEHVLMRDERSAGFAADAYARLTRRVGVCDATVGPGATNLVSPLAEAYCSSIPILAIISDIPRAWEHRRKRGNASQAIEQIEIFRTISKWQVRITDSESLEEILETAFRIATTGKPGPVVISVPVDIGSEVYDNKGNISLNLGAVYPRFRTAPDPADVELAVQTLLKAKKPLLVVGGGAHISGAYDQVRILTDRLQAPLVTTISGKGIIEETHPFACGVVGTFGNPIANEILQEADLIFYIASKIGQLTTLRFNYPPKDQFIIHLDCDPEEIGRNYPNCSPVLSDASLGLQAISDRLKNMQPENDWDIPHYREKKSQWYKKQTGVAMQSASPLKPQVVMDLLNEHITEKDLVVCDASLASGWASAYLQATQPGQNIIAPRGLASLGWGAPAAIGAALARPDKERIILLAGDGGFAYSVQELEVMARLKLPVVTLVFNNSILGWIKHIQKQDYDEQYISTDFTHVDFSMVAKGFGAKGYQVDHLEGLTDCFKACSKISNPVVIDITVDQWETPVLVFPGD
jgi:acetolactate synthase I/II/III large subunit